MARAKMDLWNIRFGVLRDSAGYAWQVSKLDKPAVLAPVDHYHQTGPNRISESAAVRRKEGEHGLSIARKAYMRFSTLARSLEDLQRQNNDLGFAAMTKGGSDDTDRDARRQLDKTAERLIVDYANTFGTLWGDDDHRTLDAWIKEALRFLDATDIAAAVVQPGGDRRAFNACIQKWGNDRFFDYVSHRPHGARYRIVTKGSEAEYGDGEAELTEKVDWFQWFVAANSMQRARFTFRMIVNAKLDGGLSLAASLRDPGKAAVVPKHLIHLLYTRMWLYNDMAPMPDRTCPVCGKEIKVQTDQDGKVIKGRMSRRYCSDRCKQKQHRQRQSGG